MKSIIQEFRDFIAKGNMMEIAVGLLIAAAFGAVVTALTKDIINPIIGLFGKADFGNLYFILKDPNHAGAYGPTGAAYTVADAEKLGETLLKYGDFITALINFVISAFVVFFLLKAYNKLAKKPEPVEVVAEPVPTKEELLLAEIRDLLKNPASAK